MLIDRDRPRRWLVWLLLIVAVASLASSVRSSAGLPIALAAAIVVLTAPIRWRWRGLAAAGVAVAYLSVSGLGMAGLREYRDSQVGGELGSGQPVAHTFWHPAYLGLGYLPNDDDINWRDDIALADARRKTPGVEYLSQEYEETLRELTVDIVREDPLRVAGLEAQKLVVVIKDGALYLAAVSLLLPAFMLLGPGARERRRLILLAAPAVAVNVVPPLLGTPYLPFELAFELGLWGTLSLLIVLCLLWLLAAAAAEGRSPRELLRGSVASALRSDAGRRALACSTAGLAAVVAAALAAGSIERRATDWQNAAPPPLPPEELGL
jgi:hypothetical protein